MCKAVPRGRERGPAGGGGGAAGEAGRFQINGQDVSEGRKLTMQPNDRVVFETPGGGGYGEETGQ